MYYMVLNTAMISVGTGLLKLDNSPISFRFVAAIYFVGLCSSLIGASAIKKGHEYYRRSIVKKTLIEDLLGLTTKVAQYPAFLTLGVGSTAGQAEHLRTSRSGGMAWRTITQQLTIMLYLLRY